MNTMSWDVSAPSRSYFPAIDVNLSADYEKPCSFQPFLPPIESSQTKAVNIVFVKIEVVLTYRHDCLHTYGKSDFERSVH